MLRKDQFLYDISGYLRHSIFIRDTLSVICTKVPARLTLFQILPVYMIRKNIRAKLRHQKSLQHLRNFYDPVISKYPVYTDSCFVSSI